MKITVKRNLIIFHEPYDWAELSDRIKKDYGDNIFLISWRLKRELGFTIRYHKGLEQHDSTTWEIMKSEGWDHRYHYQSQVHLDFWTESQMSFFMLKYLNN
jgi:hypothetical protein